MMAIARYEPVITRGNVFNLVAVVLTAIGMLVGGLMALGELREAAKQAGERIRAVEVSAGQRMEGLERADRKQTQAAEAAKEKLGDIQGDVKTLAERSAAQQRQLDRIERAVDALGNRRGPP